jgi:hypothetical protein
MFSHEFQTSFLSVVPGANALSEPKYTSANALES